MQRTADWLIVGGGVIGLMLARALAAAGATVTVVERARCGGEASWAGGGIVSPLYPWRYPEAVTRLAAEAQSAYPALADALLAESGVDIELHRHGLLMLQAEDAAEALSWSAQHGQPVEEISAAEARALQPGVHIRGARALWMPDVASLRNPRLLRALRIALERHPRVQLLENRPVLGVLRDDERVVGVRTEAGNLEAGGTVVCAGAWTQTLLEPLGLKLPIVPVRGQMLRFEPVPDLLQRIVLADGRYVIPRADGHILVGSTLEYVGFRKAVTAEAYRSLRQSAVSLLPELECVPVVQHWCGLRPGAPGGIPQMGPVAPFEGLYVSAGHFRNGLVLAPAATRFMQRCLSGDLAAADADPYLPRSQRVGEPAG